MATNEVQIGKWILDSGCTFYMKRVIFFIIMNMMGEG